jgi:MerR family redox-sensitive transcriptional activator SoxR
VVSPKFTLIVGALGRLGCLGRLRGDHREIAPKETHFVAIAGANLVEDASVIPSAAGWTAKVAVLDDGDRGIGRAQGGIIRQARRADRLGLGPRPEDKSRYYERIGVLPAAQRVSGQRVYNRDILEYLEAITIGQNLGFSLEEIKTLLGNFRSGENPSEECQKMARAKIQELDELIAKAQQMKKILEHGLSCQCTSLSGCYLHEEF